MLLYLQLTDFTGEKKTGSRDILRFKTRPRAHRAPLHGANLATEAGECGAAFTEQQVDQDLLPGQRVAPAEAHQRADDPREAVPRERQQADHGAAAAPGGRRVGAHPHALGQADVDGEQGVDRYPLEGGVQQHAVLLGHSAGLPAVPAAAVGGVFARLARLVLDLTRSPGAASALRRAAASSDDSSAAAAAAQGLMVQGHELGSAQDAVPLPRPGSRVGTRGHDRTGPKFSLCRLPQPIVDLREICNSKRCEFTPRQ